MADQEHLDILQQGVETWNRWRQMHPKIQPDLARADLSGASLSRADLARADLSGAQLYHAELSRANLFKANLSRADLSEASLSRADLARADLSGAQLSRTDLGGANLYKVNLYKANLYKTKLSGADLFGSNLSEADLSEANLSEANLSEANLSEANLTGCRVYAIAAWNVQLDKAIQSSLIITRSEEPTITVDDLEVAQFVYLLLNNKKIRNVIDTITSKVVLILGRFTPERKRILDALRNELHKRNYTPVLFDFEKPDSRNITETISLLARMARFVIADITDAKSIPQELAFIVPDLPSVPVQPLLESSQREYGMFEYFTKFPWVLPIYHYTDQASLLQSIQGNVIEPAEQKAKELTKR